MAANDLQATIQRILVTPPACVAGAAPILDPGDAVDGVEQFGTHFRLGCPCGSREMAVLCFPTKVGSDVLNLAPLALQCTACSKVIEVFDPARHGYDGEVGDGGAGKRGSGARQPFRCTACGHAAGEPIASFSFNDPESFETLPPELHGREQDTFDWFTLEVKCAGCGEVEYVVDYECA